MDGFRFPDRARVKLKDGIDPSFYNGLAKVGNEGVITGRRCDKLGFPEIFIKWDREHWAYNQQPDGWTYEDHFELVKESQVDDKEKREILQQAASAFADQMAKIMGVVNEGTTPAEAPQEEKPSNEPPFANREERFAEHTKRAIELLQQEGVESFFVTTVKRVVHPDAREGELRASVAHDSISPEAELAVGAQLAGMAAQYHEAAVILQLYTISESKYNHGQTE